jgi:hypothetical protein
VESEGELEVVLEAVSEVV